MSARASCTVFVTPRSFSPVVPSSTLAPPLRVASFTAYAIYGLPIAPTGTSGPGIYGRTR